MNAILFLEVFLYGVGGLFLIGIALSFVKKLRVVASVIVICGSILVLSYLGLEIQETRENQTRFITIEKTP